MTDDPDGLNSLPVEDPEDELLGQIYESVYTEDTVPSGVGLIAYDKELDVETSGQITGQWNIEATKELEFYGIGGARVSSADTIFVDGAAWPDPSIPEMFICPFAGDDEAIYVGTFCNRAEAGSTIDMTLANVRTTSTDRFVMPSADHPVELNHDIRVSEVVTDLPSMGMASAYMEVLIQEGRAIGIVDGVAGDLVQNANGIHDPLMERIEFHEETSAGGAITLFGKFMHYESVLTGGSGVTPVPV